MADPKEDEKFAEAFSSLMRNADDWADRALAARFRRRLLGHDENGDPILETDEEFRKRIAAEVGDGEA